AAHGAGIPIRPVRPRGRGYIDPVEFAEYAVAHMRPSPRFTPMGHGMPAAMAGDPRGSLPRSYRGSSSGSLNQALAETGRSVPHASAMNLPRQPALGSKNQMPLAMQTDGGVHPSGHHHLRHHVDTEQQQQQGGSDEVEMASAEHSGRSS
ncbi:hypothetical protein GGI07_003431, partial [Coemansia sp. Benny D115]